MVKNIIIIMAAYFLLKEIVPAIGFVISEALCYLTMKVHSPGYCKGFEVSRDIDERKKKEKGMDGKSKKGPIGFKSENIEP